MTTINYDWDEIEDNIVEEYDDAGATIAEYATEPEQFGNVISQRRSGQDSCYHYDAVGSSLALTNASGDVTDVYAYSAFGEVAARTGSTVNHFQYVGQRQYFLDEATGICDIRHRTHSTKRSRW